MRIKFDLLSKSEWINEQRMLVTVTRFQGVGADETFQRSVDVDLTDHLAHYPQATEEQRHCVAEAVGLHWMLVYDGIVPFEYSDDRTRPASGRHFRFQFHHLADLPEVIDAAPSMESGYDKMHPLGVIGTLYSDRLRGAVIEPADPEKQQKAEDPSVPVSHCEDHCVWVRNRVDETIHGTAWGAVGLRHAAMAKAYRHHVAIETGRKREQYIAKSPFHFLCRLLTNHRFDPADNQEDFDFLLTRWLEQQEVQDAAIWVIRNPGHPAMEDWLITVTTEFLSGAEKTIIRDVNRMSPEVREKLRREFREKVAG